MHCLIFWIKGLSSNPFDEVVMVLYKLLLHFLSENAIRLLIKEIRIRNGSIRLEVNKLEFVPLPLCFGRKHCVVLQAIEESISLNITNYIGRDRIFDHFKLLCVLYDQ